MNPTFRWLASLAVLAVSGTSATPAQAAGNAVNTMGAPYYDVIWQTFNVANDVVDEQFLDYTASTNGTIGVNTVTGTLWNGLPAIQQAVVTNDGRTYWARASAPRLFDPPTDTTVVGGGTTVTVVQSFTKTSADAELRFTYTGGLLQTFIDPEVRPDCVATGIFCAIGLVEWEVSVWRNDTQNQPLLMVESGSVTLDDLGGTFQLNPTQYALDGSPVNPLWSWDCPRCGLPAFGLAQATLQAPFTGIVDLSVIPFDPNVAEQPEFTVLFSLTASAKVDSEWAGATAWARDPLDLGNDAGIGFTVFDLQPTNNPVGVVPEPASALMLALGLAGLVGWRNRRTVCAP